MRDGILMRIVMRSIAAILFLAIAVPWKFLLPETIIPLYYILSSDFFSEYYKLNHLVAGGAFDQNGLTRILAIILFMETFALLGRNLLILTSKRRGWRIACNLLFLLGFVLPVCWALIYTWELSRYIAVMGITPARIAGVRFAVLLFFVPLFCMLRWNMAKCTPKRTGVIFLGCAVLAYSAVAAIDARAIRAVDTHPRPAVCFPNRVAVPEKPATATDYGLKEICFGIGARR